MKTIIIALLITRLFYSTAFADVGDELLSSVDAKGAEAVLSEDARQIAGELDVTGNYDTKGVLSRLWEKLREEAVQQFKNGFIFVSKLLALCAAAALCLCFIEDNAAESIINLALCCGISTVMIAESGGLVNQITDALQQMSDYSKAALPGMFIAAGASGAVLSAPVKYSAACLGIDVALTLSDSVVLPLIYAYLGISLSRALFPNSILNAASKAAKWCAMTAMTLCTTAFVAYINLSGLISGSTDAVAVKTARTVISTAVPVVGGMISDASAAVLAGARLVKYSFGAYCLAAVCGICVVPFAVLGVKLILLKAAAAIGEAVAGLKAGGLLNDCVVCCSMLLGLLGCCTLMVFISFISAMKAVT